MECNFVVGQKVVCVRDYSIALPRIHVEIFPVLGEVYTIREVLIASVRSRSCPGVRLVEIVNEPQNYVDGMAECAFMADAFRPVRTTNLEIIEKLKIPNPELEDA